MKASSISILFLWLTTIFFLGSRGAALGQVQLKDSVSAGQVNVVQDFKPVTVDAVKISPVPTIHDSVPPPVVMKYAPFDRFVPIRFVPPQVSAAKMKGEPLSKLYPGYVKAGFGLYSTSLMEFGFGSLRSKKYNFSIGAKHFASSGKIENHPAAGFADNDIKLSGHYFLNQHDLSAEVQYYHHKFQYYGGVTPLEVPATIVAGRQFYSLIGASLGFKPIKPVKEEKAYEYDGALRYYNFFDRYQNNEFYMGGWVNFGRYLNKELIGGKVSVDYYKNNYQSDSLNDAIITLAPYATTKRDRWEGRMGLKIMIETNAGSTHFYPDLYARYTLIKDFLSVFTEVNGNLQRNGLKSFSEQNPFVYFGNGFRLANTSTRLNLTGGVKGNISSAVFYNLSASYKIIDSIPLFINRTVFEDSVQNHFVAYYESLNTTQLSAEIGYRWADRLLLSGYVKYYRYLSLESQEFAWQLPQIESGIKARYNLGDKLTGRLEFIYWGDRYALFQTVNNPQTLQQEVISTSQKLRGIPDLNIGVDYHYTSRLGAFVQFNNILVQRYYWWNQYPLQRFNLMAGLKLLF
jgi:hypothetical protein